MKSVAEEFLPERVVSSSETRGRATFEINLGSYCLQGYRLWALCFDRMGHNHKYAQVFGQKTLHSLQETVC